MIKSRVWNKFHCEFAVEQKRELQIILPSGRHRHARLTFALFVLSNFKRDDGPSEQFFRSVKILFYNEINAKSSI